MLSSLLDGLNTVFGNMAFCALGAFLGVASGALPGLGSAAVVAMLLPFTFVLSPTASIVLLVGAYIGHLLSATNLAILVDSSGGSSGSGAASPDGYQLARLGFSGRALAVSAIAAFIGATAATAFLAVMGSPITSIASNFTSPEYFAAIVVTLVASVGIGKGPIVPAFGMVALGLLFGTVGTDLESGIARLNFGFNELADGVGVVPVAIGMFAIGELLAYGGTKDRRDLVVTRVTSLVPEPADLGRILAPIARGTVVGTLLGMLPGAGSSLPSSAAYAAERSLSRNRDRLGKGAIEGVAAPASSIASAGPTSFLPLLTLGLPSSAAMALIVAALAIHGVVAGPGLASKQPMLFWGATAAVWVASLFALLIMLPIVSGWMRVLTLPYSWLFPVIVAFCAIGSVSVNNTVSDVVLLAVFALLGYGFIKLGFETLPFLLGFMLSPLMEEHLRRALVVGRGSPSAFFETPISIILLLISVLLIVGSIVAQRRRH
jgi:putative tricarboxylic transport membrane protein